jgi:thiamine biosynthesis protein ThiS
MSSSGEQAHHPQEVIANGRPVAFNPPATLSAFLQQLGLPPRSVVVELNGEAVAPSEFDSRSLSAGDRMEIVRITAGG